MDGGCGVGCPRRIRAVIENIDRVQRQIEQRPLRRNARRRRQRAARGGHADAVSANDFDDAYKGHLDGFITAFPAYYNQFRGSYGSEALLVAGAPPADGSWGDYAFATVSGNKRLFFLNADTDTWVDAGGFTVAMTADEIAAIS